MKFPQEVRRIQLRVRSRHFRQRKNSIIPAYKTANHLPKESVKRRSSQEGRVEFGNVMLCMLPGLCVLSSGRDPRLHERKDCSVHDEEA